MENEFLDFLDFQTFRLLLIIFTKIMKNISTKLNFKTWHNLQPEKNLILKGF